MEGNKYKVIAKDDLELDYHTWTKGLDYQVVEKGDYFTLASNESSVNYLLTAKEKVLNEFEEMNRMENYEILQMETHIPIKIFKIEDEGGENTWIKAFNENQAVETFKGFIDYEIVRIEEVTGDDLYKRTIVESQETEPTYISLAKAQKDRPIPSIIACSVY